MALMDEVFSEYLDKFVIVYIDGIPLYSDTCEKHLMHMRKALQVLREQKVKSMIHNVSLLLDNLNTSDYYAFRRGHLPS